jgi:hypothetical protein
VTLNVVLRGNVVLIDVFEEESRERYLDVLI